MTTGLEGWRRDDVATSAGRVVTFWRGTGPAVLVLHEVPGVTPAVLGFAERLVERGLTVVLPSLFGEPGREPTLFGGALQLARVCVSREFAVWATGRTSRVVGSLREVAHQAHDRCGGPGVGVVGMCVTGGFALAMAVDPVVLAPVLSQPALPLPTSARRRRDLGVDAADRAVLAQRAANGLCALGLRFSEDAKSPPERFAALRELLGTAFDGVEIPSGDDDPWQYGRHAHSVLTEDYRDDAGSPTRMALDRVVAFVSERLGVAP